MKSPPRGLFPVFLLVDLAFLLYWAVTAFALLPLEWLYQDYRNAILVDWNWSFLPLDLLISFTGLYSIRLFRSGSSRWHPFAFTSLILTMCSGLMAISFWTLRHDFSLSWWLPNLFLLCYPFRYFRFFLKQE